MDTYFYSDKGKMNFQIKTVLGEPLSLIVKQSSKSMFVSLQTLEADKVSSSSTKLASEPEIKVQTSNSGFNKIIKIAFWKTIVNKIIDISSGYSFDIYKVLTEDLYLLWHQLIQ